MKTKKIHKHLSDLLGYYSDRNADTEKSGKTYRLTVEIPYEDYVQLSTYAIFLNLKKKEIVPLMIRLFCKSTRLQIDAD